MNTNTYVVQKNKEAGLNKLPPPRLVVLGGAPRSTAPAGGTAPSYKKLRKFKLVKCKEIINSSILVNMLLKLDN